MTITAILMWKISLQRLGSVRGEDIPYIFGLPLVAGGAFFPRNYSRSDNGVAEAMLTFFTNFAKTGNPNEPHKIESVDYGIMKEKTRFRGLTWEQYETGSQQYLTIGMSSFESLPRYFFLTDLISTYRHINFPWNASRRSQILSKFFSTARSCPILYGTDRVVHTQTCFIRKKKENFLNFAIVYNEIFFDASIKKQWIIFGI